ncbi:MAG: MotA/TolQ/ExbB proton channel family protein [Thalassolituus sp.]|jgi:biopolymer transport protein ExbB|uniref:TonB system biopolymer transport component n=2 Tax=root TaxID=1 RepID=M5DPI3_9GAMM|nr:MotA/TolQ/ExbB proton channel family protein [Thalassolituus oleivorans]PCI47225.1 MAG: MotA/TolQ/ExbB proton channel family protein [Oceanospirillales bacterium]PHQ87496.1 MAG: MotA/TolQ/ExbB proton channel family protein [Thalassobium sp.]AHK16464.1 biopolymer transporter ExbB [Thalassolituus oleivorans R6-15]APR67890.1 biopolymer transporter ExbB [Thalassolituus oleivorans]MBQ0727384.1 MotA/TolQ/ExbB proton channel family protein [Thalassolituus oleivorans]|tara:strand:+ start:147 stop:668 length:522 start_codon:yes stop_codon:yes gene_type:complete
MFGEFYEPVYLFMERGGDVLYAIFGLILILWLMVLERAGYFIFSHRAALAAAKQEWEARKERTSWAAHQIRHDLITGLNIGLQANMSTIKMLIGLAPLFGLLGTVTGMIEVFDVMAFIGNGSPKAMASGISKATIPTMAGMVGALTGVFAQSLLDRYIKREKIRLEDQLTFDH